MMKTTFLLTGLLVFGARFVLAQPLAVNNVKATQTAGVATVLYDLAGPVGSTYYVRLLYSTDGGNSFSDELSYAEGDVRANVTPGVGKKITWSSKQEVGGLSGNVVFKVTAESKLKLPSAIKNENVKIEFIDITRSGTSLTFEIKVFPLKDLENYFFSVGSVLGGSRTYIIDNRGNKVYTKEGSNFGQMVAGVPVTKDLVFEGLAFDATSISLLSIEDSKFLIYQVRGIQLPKE